MIKNTRSPEFRWFLESLSSTLDAVFNGSLMPGPYFYGKYPVAVVTTAASILLMNILAAIVYDLFTSGREQAATNWHTHVPLKSMPLLSWVDLRIPGIRKRTLFAVAWVAGPKPDAYAT